MCIDFLGTKCYNTKRKDKKISNSNIKFQKNLDKIVFCVIIINKKKLKIKVE